MLPVKYNYIMKQEFIITIQTPFGTGIIKKKAFSFKEAYFKCALKWRKKAIMVENEDGDIISIDELLGLELDA